MKIAPINFQGSFEIFHIFVSTFVAGILESLNGHHLIRGHLRVGSSGITKLVLMDFKAKRAL